MKKLLLSFGAALLLVIPASAYAIPTGVMFGGAVLPTVIPCTCSAGIVIDYTPFWSGQPFPGGGALYLPPGAIVFQFFQPGVPATFELGTYTPGLSGCLIPDPAQVAAGDPDPCDPGLPVPALGTIQYMGTSSLSPISEFLNVSF